MKAKINSRKRAFTRDTKSKQHVSLSHMVVSHESSGVSWPEQKCFRHAYPFHPFWLLYGNKESFVHRIKHCFYDRMPIMREASNLDPGLGLFTVYNAQNAEYLSSGQCNVHGHRKLHVVYTVNHALFNPTNVSPVKL